MLLKHFNLTPYFFLLVSIVYESFAIDNYLSDTKGSLNNDPRLLKKTVVNNVTTSETFARYNRQLDSDVESRFHINTNTIIRTGESRNLGAKYVNETILPSNHECLTRCLETPNCNTAVYEEKTLRVCYMFDCGQPPKFLCKFTQHDSFVSSILKISQHSYELSQWGSQAKHENELAELRTSEVQISSSSSPSIQETVTSVVPVIKPKNLTKPEDQCHHYQFKCINSSECIAIYNVCDGIPQCPDGSDESPEMKCHEKTMAKEAKTMMQRPVEPPHPIKHTISKPKPPSPVSTVSHAPQIKHVLQPADNTNIQPNKMGSRFPEKPKSVWPDGPEKQAPRSDYYHRTDDSDGLGSPFDHHKHSQFVAANDPHVEGLNRWSSDYDQYPARPVPLEPQYTPYENNYQRGDDPYLPNPLSPEYESGKNYDSYRREDGPSYWANQESPQDNTYPVEEYPQAAMHTLNKPNNYPDKESLYAQQLQRTAAQYPEIKQRLIHKPIDISPSMQQNRATEIEEYKSRRYPLHRQSPYMTYEEALEKQLSNYPDMKPKPFETSRNLDEPMYSNDELLRASLVNQLPMEMDRPHHPYQYDKQIENAEETPQHQTEHNVKSKQKEISVEKSIKVPLKNDSSTKLKPTPTTKSVQRTVLDFKMSVTELYQASRTHSQETNSAVLALVMGLTITFLLFLFLGCRVKTIRKRMSRKGRGLAHDADYLVNGMYL